MIIDWLFFISHCLSSPNIEDEYGTRALVYIGKVLGVVLKLSYFLAFFEQCKYFDARWRCVRNDHIVASFSNIIHINIIYVLY